MMLLVYNLREIIPVMRDLTGNSVIILVIERKMTHTSASDFKLLIIMKKTDKLLV